MPVTKQSKSTTNRLEDFIDLAKKGEKTKLGISLRKQVIVQKGPPEKPYYLKVDKDMYLLMADFIFGTAPDIITVSKVYAMGCVVETITEEQVNKSIANERLKMDYLRLKHAGIKFDEEYY